jgi:hypothetical protein
MNIVSPRRACVKIRSTVRRVSKHPFVRSGTLLKKHVVRGAALGLVPDAVNDVAFHHAQLNLDEVIHVVQDTTSIASMTFLFAIFLTRIPID